MKNLLVQTKFEPIYVSTQHSLAITPHLHKEIELIYVKKGSAVAYADNKSSKISEGDLFITFPNQIHYYLNSEIGEYYVIIFSQKILYGMSELLDHKLPKSNVFGKNLNKDIPSLFEKLFDSNSNFSSTLKAGLLNQIMALALSEKTFVQRSKNSNHTLQTVFEYCAQNFTEDINLDSVSEALHLNKYHISHLMNKQLGMSFNNCINTFRINKSCDLLVDTDKKISEISEEVGFGSIRTFNRAFSQIMSITPLEFRAQIQSETADIGKY